MKHPSTVKEIVDEFSDKGGTFVPNWGIEHEKKSEALDWLTTTLTNHIEGLIAELGGKMKEINVEADYSDAAIAHNAALKTAQELLRKTLL